MPVAISRADSVFGKVYPADLESVLAEIRSGKWKADIEKLRRIPITAPKEISASVKKKLPAFTGGVYKTELCERTHANIEKTRVFVLDIDHIADPSEKMLDNPQSIKGSIDDIGALADNGEWICQVCRAAFRSPSGDGIKFVFVIDKDIEDPKEYKRIWNYLVKKYELQFLQSVDRATCDITRLCFLSYDPYMYENPDALIRYDEIANLLDMFDEAPVVSITLMNSSDSVIFTEMARKFEVRHYRTFRDMCSAASNLGESVLNVFYDNLLGVSRATLSPETFNALSTRKQAYVRSFMAEHDRVPLQYILDMAKQFNIDIAEYLPDKGKGGDKKTPVFDYSKQIKAVRDWMNDRFACWQMGNGVITIPQIEKKKYYNISQDEPTADSSLNTASVQKRTDFQAYMQNRKLHYINEKGEDASYLYYDLWWNSPDRRNCNSMICYPAKDIPRTTVNAWTGFNVDPDKMKRVIEKEDVFEPVCQPVLDFIKHTICSSDPESNKFVLDWLSEMLQNPTPANKPGVALVLRSTEMGTGKGTFSTIVRDLIGPVHAVELGDTKNAFATFNSIMENKLLVVLDEAVFAGDKKVIKEVMGLITRPTITIRPLFINPYDTDNPSRFIIMSNDEHTVSVAPDDRRFYTVEVNGSRKDDFKYFTGLRYCMANGGKESLFNYLMNRKVAREDLSTRSHRNEATLSQVRQSFDAFDNWIVSLLERQSISCGFDTVIRLSSETGTEVTVDQMYQDYMRRFGNAQRFNNPNTFEKRLKSMGVAKVSKRVFIEKENRIAVMWELKALNKIASENPIYAPDGWQPITMKDFFRGSNEHNSN